MMEREVKIQGNFWVPGNYTFFIIGGVALLYILAIFSYNSNGILKYLKWTQWLH